VYEETRLLQEQMLREGKFEPREDPVAPDNENSHASPDDSQQNASSSRVDSRL
ncbi:hypothetical protein FRC09_003596, partial [Ceratobasidium sp. 395]